MWFSKVNYIMSIKCPTHKTSLQKKKKKGEDGSFQGKEQKMILMEAH